MAQIETAQGSKLQWPDEKAYAESPVDTESAPSEEVETPAMADTNTSTELVESPDAPAPGAPTTGRRPTKIMADLSRAMQTAAASSRDETMARFSSDAKVVVEEIQVSATGEGADIRRQADDDVAAVREWSKGEIARIREEAETRIGMRKGTLDSEMEAHAAIVEARIQQVASTVQEFEAEMATFFERLLAEEDPTRIASMAETMPEPPDLVGIAASIAGPAIAPFDPAPPTSPSWPDEDVANAAGDDEPVSELTETTEAIVGDALAASETPAELDFASAEAEAEAAAAALTEDESAMTENTEAADDETAAEPVAEEISDGSEDVPTSSHATTRVSVVGLVSVASIATFKRSLGRASGVSGIRVASGPDGEFVFTVEHESGMSLGDAIAALAGFEARVTGESDSALEIVAHDPDANV